MKALFAALLAGIAAHTASAKPPNILFIAIDDLRPELGAYGVGHIHSPHMDRFAESALLFEKAYTSVPTCGASRASLFSGVRPNPKRFLTHLAIAEEEVPWAVTMNTHFKKHGYTTLSLGKVFHNPSDHADGWSEKPWRSRLPAHADPENVRNEKKGIPRGSSCEIGKVADEGYPDGELAAKAVAQLAQLAKQPDQPFFLAVGFVKPHLPFAAPEKYWKLYPEESIRLPDNYRLPTNAPDAARYNWGELRRYSDIPAKGPITEEKAKQLIRGYYACVSFVDAQVGKVLDALEKQGLADDTVVVIWGDHGWNLGDHTYWCKHTCYESSLHIPLIVRVPGMAKGARTKVLTESVDLFPTLCELTRLPTPDTAEGQSLVGLLKDPSATSEDLAFSRFGKGDTIRTKRYRYTEYRDGKGKVVGRMLYDHQSDPLENENIVDAEGQEERVKSLAMQLKKARNSTRKN